MLEKIMMQNSAPKTDRMTSHSPIRQTIDFQKMKPTIHKRLSHVKRKVKQNIDFNDSYISSKNDHAAISLFSGQEARVHSERCQSQSSDYGAHGGPIAAATSDPLSRSIAQPKHQKQQSLNVDSSNMHATFGSMMTNTAEKQSTAND